MSWWSKIMQAAVTLLPWAVKRLPEPKEAPVWATISERGRRSFVRYTPEGDRLILRWAGDGWTLHLRGQTIGKYDMLSAGMRAGDRLLGAK